MPNAEEKISYGMPTFALNGNLVHFAAFKKHIGLYPTSSGMVAFLPELSEYKTGKGSIQFPLEKPIPYDLISRITKYRVAENIKRAEEKLKKKKWLIRNFSVDSTVQVIGDLGKIDFLVKPPIKMFEAS